MDNNRLILGDGNIRWASRMWRNIVQLLLRDGKYVSVVIGGIGIVVGNGKKVGFWNKE